MFDVNHSQRKLRFIIARERKKRSLRGAQGPGLVSEGVK